MEEQTRLSSKKGFGVYLSSLGFGAQVQATALRAEGYRSESLVKKVQGASRGFCRDASTKMFIASATEPYIIEKFTKARV